MFQHVTGNNVCPKCKQKEEEMFQVVKDYLRKNPGASMSVVSEETEVAIALVESFLRQGRLEVTPGSAIALTCESCGAKIFTGRFCSKCSSNLVGELTSVAKQMTEDNQNKVEKNEKMRFLKADRIK